MTPEQFLEFARVLPEPLLLITGEGEILAINRPATTLIGYKNNEIKRKSLFDFVTEAPEKLRSYLQACSRSRQMVLGSLTFILPDGKGLSCRTEGAVIQPSSLDTPAINLLRLQNRVAASCEFILLNQKINELTKEIYRRQQVEAALLVKNEELQHAIEELKITQFQLVQTEKMSSLGQLVAGVAHEINNPVNFIHGNLVHAKEYVEDLVDLVQSYQQEYPHPSSKIQEKVEAIDLDFIIDDLNKVLQSMQAGTERILGIIQSLRNFSRLDEAEVKAVDIHEGIESTLVILQHRLKPKPNCPGIQVIKDYGNLPLVDCYPGQLNQVFMNILSNAIDALEESFSIRDLSVKDNLHQQNPLLNPHPTIWIRTEKIDCDALDHCPINRIIIRIADNAGGMPDSIRQQIFNPFFTTKPVGQGTGLGLSISYQIIQKTHHGQLNCHSKPDQGTEFVIELPLYQAAREADQNSRLLSDAFVSEY